MSSGCRSEAGAVAHGQARADPRRLALPLRIDHHRAVAAPRPRGGAIGEPVPVQVEPRARADLERVDRARVRVREREEAREQRDRAARLVGLRRGADELGDRGALAREERARERPHLVHAPVDARGGIVGCELAVRTHERRVVQRAHEPQRQRVLARVRRPVADEVGDGSARGEVVAHARDQLRGEGRPIRGAECGLLAEMDEDPVVGHGMLIPQQQDSPSLRRPPDYASGPEEESCAKVAVRVGRCAIGSRRSR